MNGPRGPQLVENAKVRHGDTDDVGLRTEHVLRVNRPHAVVREVKGALGLTLTDPLEVADNARVVRARRCYREHSDESRRVAGQNVDDDIEGTI